MPSFSSPSSFRVVLDARALSHPQRGGFQSAARALVQGLGEASMEGVEVLLYLDRPLAPEAAAQLSPRLQTRILSPNRLQSDLLLFARQVRRDAPDLVHGLNNYVPRLGATNRIPTTVTIHDALGLKTYPFELAAPISRSAREQAMYNYTRWTTRHSAHTARRIATDSHASASELRGLSNLWNNQHNGQDKIQIVYPGLALPLPTEAQIERNGKRRGQHVLVMASPDPRKNLTLFFEAWVQSGLVTRRDLTLRVVCSSGAIKSRLANGLRENGISNPKIHRNPSDEKLAGLYARSDVFVFPSLWEGFGLPPLEAMLCGCAVAASNAPCLPETLGDVPLFFAPNDRGAMAKAVVHLLKNTEERRQRAAAGQAWASRYTSRAYAEAMVEFWRKALSSK